MKIDLKRECSVIIIKNMLKVNGYSLIKDGARCQRI